MNKDKLPPIELYRKYLNIASIRFNLTIDQCRDKYGLYTIAQWDELFKSDKTEMELAIDWWDAKTPAEQNEVIEQNGGETNITRLYFLEHPELKEVDILKEDYNILNYKYAECIKVNTGLKEVNKILVDALLKIDAIAYRFYGWKVADDLAEIAKTSLKEANLIK